MADVVSNFAPMYHVDPNEPGLVQAFAATDGELATYGAPINRAATGAAYNAAAQPNTVRTVGYGGGYRGTGGAGAYIAASPGDDGHHFTTSVIARFEVDGWSNVFSTYPANARVIRNNSGAPYVSVDGATFSAGPNLVGRGYAHVALCHDGTNQLLWLNGRLYAFNAVAYGASQPTMIMCGGGGLSEVMVARQYNIRMTEDENRASYIRDLASKVIWQWRPRVVGEGPSSGILTGMDLLGGEFFCPLGSANLKFVYVRDRHGNDGALFLNETTVGNHRISFPVDRPFFGSWLINQVVRDPATDDSIISFDTIRGESHTLGSGASYWIRSHQSAGLWSLEWYRGGIGPFISVTMPVPVANSRIQIFATRRVSGEFQIHARVFGDRWYSSALSAADTTYLSTSYISFLPRGGYLGQTTYYQGEMNCNELCI